MIICYYSHYGSGNHGCEAIVRSSTKMLYNHTITLISERPQDELFYNIDKICSLKNEKLNKKSFRFIKSYIKLKLFKNFHELDILSKETPFYAIKGSDIAMSIGGDNYCYQWVGNYVKQHTYAKKWAKRTVLWGCSVEPDVVAKPEIAEDLASYDLITARESISYEALKKVNSNTILVADPAFQLDRKDLPLPKGFVEGNTVGINVSPLAANAGNLVYENYEQLVQHIIDTTDMQVALIPHVVWDFNNDFDELNKLFEKFKDTGRVVLIEDHNCEELKGFIARCRFFVGARTHASIAAYSTCVPTLVSGYSVKARGIATDIFGTDENYAIPVQDMKTDKDLSVAFDWLMQHEDEIRNHLESFMPEYCQRSWLGAEAVEKLLNK